MDQKAITELLKLLDGSVEKFKTGLEPIQVQTYDRLLKLLAELDLKDGNIQNSVRNIRLLGTIKQELDDLVLNDKYLNSVKEFVTAYGVVSRLNNEYFSSIAKRYKPPAVLAEVRKQAVNDAVAALTENGIGANYTDQLRDIVKTAITSGGSYSKLAEQLRSTVLGTSTEAGKLVRYAGTVATDGINIYNRTYIKAVSDDLGLSWFRYVGSNMNTTREFCLAMTQSDNEYFHVSQIPSIIKGNLNSGKVSTAGQREGTNSINFIQFAGGYNCGHSIVPVPAALVPASIRARVEGVVSPS